MQISDVDDAREEISEQGPVTDSITLAYWAKIRNQGAEFISIKFAELSIAAVCLRLTLW